MRTVGSHCVSWVMYGTEGVNVCAAGNLLPFQTGDRWLMGNVSSELTQDQAYRSGHREDAKIPPATIAPEKLLKPRKESV